MKHIERAAYTHDQKTVISVAAALAAVSLTAKVDTPFWPSSLSAPPPLGLIVFVVGLVLAMIHYNGVWWRGLDEKARQAHRKAWWTGGNLGVSAGAAALVVLLSKGVTLTAPLLHDPVAWAATGFLCLLGGQAVGYGLALLLNRRAG
jgi:hypothetical protein